MSLGPGEGSSLEYFFLEYGFMRKPFPCREKLATKIPGAHIKAESTHTFVGSPFFRQRTCFRIKPGAVRSYYCLHSMYLPGLLFS